MNMSENGTQEWYSSLLYLMNYLYGYDMYIECLKEYREKQKTDKLVLLMRQEMEDYYQQCKYFMA